jgi:hypothetical protein
MRHNTTSGHPGDSSLREQALGGLEITGNKMSTTQKGAPTRSVPIPCQSPPMIPISGFSHGRPNMGCSGMDFNGFFLNFAMNHAQGDPSGNSMPEMGPTQDWNLCSRQTGLQGCCGLSNWNDVGQVFGCQGPQEMNPQSMSIDTEFAFHMSRAQDAPPPDMLATPRSELSQDGTSLPTDQVG